VCDAGHADAESLAILHQAAETGAADVDPMVGAFPRHHAHALTLTAGAVIGKGNLDGGIHGLRARVGEEHLVDALRRERRHPSGEFELGRMGALEGRAVIELHNLVGNRVGDLPATVTGGATEQPRGPVEDLFALVVPVVHALATHEDPRMGLEFAVSRKRHPIVFE